jgi:invasion protein IalB
MTLMTRGAGKLGMPAWGFAARSPSWRPLGTMALAAALLWAAAAGTARADTPLPEDQLFKSWTMICRKAPLVQEEGTTPEPYCRIYHRVRAQDDKTKVIFIATVRFRGKDRMPMMILTLPAVANLQRGVTFQVDQSQIYRVNIQVCTAQSCLSEFKLTDDLMKLFRNGAQASFSFGINPQGDAKHDIPLAGFGVAVDALQKTGY